MKDLDYSNHQSAVELQEELRWIEAAKRDPSQFRYVYDKYYNTIYHFVYRRTNEEELAADLTSQTFLKAMLNLPKFTFKGVPFSAWLYRIATNEINGHYRKKKSNPVFSFEDILAHRMMDETPENMDEERLQQLTQCMQQFSTEEISLLQLRFYEDKSFKEIAFILDISEGSAKMRTYRLLERLREQMKRG